MFRLVFHFTALLISLVSSTLIVSTNDLCRTEPNYQFIEVTGQQLINIGDSILYHFDSTTCNKIIRAVWFAGVDGYLVEAFEGIGENGTPIDLAPSIGTSNFTHPAGKMSIRVTLTGVPNSTLNMIVTSWDQGLRFFGFKTLGAGTGIADMDPTKPYMLFFAIFKTYQAENGISFDFQGGLKFSMYQGTSLADNALIYSDGLTAPGCSAESSRPRFVYGNYVLVKLSNDTQAGTITFKPDTRDNGSQINITSVQPQYLTVPSCPQRYNGNDQLMEWSYRFKYTGSNKRGVAVDLLSSLRKNSSIQVLEYDSSDKLLKETNYDSSSQKFCGISSNASAVVLNYYYTCTLSSYYEQKRELTIQYYSGPVLSSSPRSIGLFSFFLIIMISFVKSA